MIKKCPFPAAGYGTRFLPATKSMPKEMMPIVSKPLIEYGVEEALQAGMNDICIVTGRGKRALEDHFDAKDDLCINDQGEGVLAQMAQLYKQFRCSIVAVMEVPEDEVHKYGVTAGQAISDDLIRVENMVEKPAKEDAPSNVS